MILKEFLFLDSTSSAESNPLILSKDIEGALLNLQVQADSGSTPNLKVMAQLDTNSDWVQLDTVSTCNSYDVARTITANGLYVIYILGYKKVKVVNEGTVGTVRAYGSVTD